MSNSLKHHGMLCLLLNEFMILDLVCICMHSYFYVNEFLSPQELENMSFESQILECECNAVILNYGVKCGYAIIKEYIMH